MLIIETVRQHLDHGFRIGVTCRCGRSEWLDLERLVREGFGDVSASQLDQRLRCRACGRKGLTVRRHGPRVDREHKRQAPRPQMPEIARHDNVLPFKPRGRR
jgi:hypothetical protein